MRCASLYLLDFRALFRNGYAPYSSLTLNEEPILRAKIFGSLHDGLFLQLAPILFLGQNDARAISNPRRS